jgi:hypothetical protein
MSGWIISTVADCNYEPRSLVPDVGRRAARTPVEDDALTACSATSAHAASSSRAPPASAPRRDPRRVAASTPAGRRRGWCRPDLVCAATGWGRRR